MHPDEINLQKIKKVYFLCEDEVGGKYIVDYQITNPSQASIGLEFCNGLMLDSCLTFKGNISNMSMERIDDVTLSADSEALDNFLKEFIQTDNV